MAGSNDVSGRATGSGDLLWVTNVPTPYRAPLWAALGDQHPLTVALLADSEPNRTWTVELEPDRYSVVSLRARPMAQSGDSVIYAPSLRLLKLISKRPRAVVLDGWESPAYLAARWWARQKGVPVIASYRSTLSTHRFSTGPVPALRRWFFRGAAAVLTAGEASTEAVTAMGIPRSQVVEGFNTVDVDRFVVGAAKHRAGRAERPGHHFIYVGQFIARKNIESLIRAFAAMRAEPDTLTLVGSGPLEHDLRLLSKQLDLEPAVSFSGHLDGDDLVGAYAEANTLVLPSTGEVWGLVVNEALASGLQAVVSTACGVVPSIEQMPGVFPAAPTAPALEVALRRSRETWSAPLRDHPITRHTPQALTAIILAAMERTSHSPATTSRPQGNETMPINVNQLRQNVIIDGKPLLTLTRGLTWAAHCAIGREAKIDIWPGGPTLQLTPKLMAHGSTSLYMKRLQYEPHLAYLAGLVKPGMTVLDIGANVGVYALTLAARVGRNGMVHAFEPGDYSLGRLRHNCQSLNPELPITLWPVALSDHEGESQLFHIGGAPTTFSLGDNTAGTDGTDGTADEAIQLTTLDLWAKSQALEKLDLIKIDVEGHEARAFNGATSTLEAHRPIILFESSSSALARNGDSPRDCWDALQSLGYRIFELRTNSLALHDHPGEGNFYAIHPESPWNRLVAKQ